MVGKVGLSPSLRETRGSDVANVQHGDAKLGNACKTTVSREKRKAMLLCGGDVKGIVCAYVVAKSPSASNQRPMRDAVNRPFKKRIDSGYCAIFADPPAQRLSAQSRQYFGVHQFRRYLAGDPLTASAARRPRRVPSKYSYATDASTTCRATLTAPYRAPRAPRRSVLPNLPRNRQLQGGWRCAGPIPITPTRARWRAERRNSMCVPCPWSKRGDARGALPVCP